MNLTVIGLHMEVTSALYEYVAAKMERITRHVDNVMNIAVTLSVDKLVHKAEVNLHLSGKNIHVKATQEDMYAAIDLLIDKLDRQVVKHKEKRSYRRAAAPVME